MKTADEHADYWRAGAREVPRSTLVGAISERDAEHRKHADQLRADLAETTRLAAEEVKTVRAELEEAKRETSEWRLSSEHHRAGMVDRDREIDQLRADNEALRARLDDTLSAMTEVSSERTFLKSRLLELRAFDVPWIKNEGLLCCPLCNRAHHEDDYADAKVHEGDCLFVLIAADDERPCGCYESYPQLQPGVLNHGPGCPRRPASGSSTGEAADIVRDGNEAGCPHPCDNCVKAWMADGTAPTAATSSRITDAVPVEQMRLETMATNAGAATTVATRWNEPSLMGHCGGCTPENPSKFCNHSSHFPSPLEPAAPSLGHAFVECPETGICDEGCPLLVGCHRDGCGGRPRHAHETKETP